MSESEIKAGDYVLATFGEPGPKMYVSGVTHDKTSGTPIAACLWFDRNNAIRHQVFDISLLKPFEDSTPKVPG